MLKAFIDASWDHVVVPVVLAILNTFWPFIHTIGYNLILTPIVIPLLIIDILESAVDIFAGIVPIASGGGTMTILDYFMGQTFVTRAFWGITLISAALCIGFSIIAVIRSMGDLDVQRPVGKVMRSVGNAMLTFLLVPFLCIASVSLAGIVLRQTSLLITATGAETSGRETVSTTGALFMAGITEDAVPSRTVAQWDYNKKTREFYRDETKSYSMLEPQMKRKLSEVINTGIVNYNYAHLGSEDLKFRNEFLREQLAANPDITFRTAEYNYLKDKYLYMRTGYGSHYRDDEGLEAFYTEYGRILKEQGSEAASEYYEKGLEPARQYDSEWLRQVLSGKIVRWIDVSTIGKDFDAYSFFWTSIITCLISWFYAVMMVMILLMFLRRIFELILLYLVSPFFVSVIPLDEGEKFKAWRERFVSTVVAGFGSVFMLKVLILLMPVIWSENFMLSSLAPVNLILKAILMAGGIFATYKSHTMISSILSERGASSEREAANLGGHYMVNNPMMMAQQGIHMGMQKVGQGASFIAGKARGAFSGGGGGGAGEVLGHKNPAMAGPMNVDNKITNINNLKQTSKRRPPDKPLPPIPGSDKFKPADTSKFSTPSESSGFTVGGHRTRTPPPDIPLPPTPGQSSAYTTTDRPLPPVPPPGTPPPAAPGSPSFPAPPTPVNRPLPPTPPPPPPPSTSNKQE